MKICIDAGHGINTPGKQSPDGMKEFEFNVVVAGYLDEILQNYKNVQTIFSHDHPTGRRDVPLRERTDKANNWGADLFISIHANAFGTGGWNNANGLETYVHNVVPQRTLDIANEIHKKLIEKTNMRNRGLKGANFHVLRETDMSAVLVECGFMTNYRDMQKLRTDSYRRTCAEAIAEAIVQHYNLDPKETQTNWTGSPALKRGDRGEMVKDLQRQLQELGYYDMDIDGLFGPGTERGVRNFQKDHDLAVDGFAGPATYEAVQKALDNPSTPSKEVFRVIVDGEQIGAYAEISNIIAQIENHIKDANEITIQRV
ncbi:N-acetylmuramoyl-L-alanine amidase [Serpentinicella sp. ANB-PHB4]|uniref:N-acetylmuramoyl-L-alanine amidase n=1 Tax=Serpentinicella sp. ANB-PHB4 TaxID=3074076 RepID=UPI00285D6F6A|nr:N-acetylmuramoyl-L-alanine amidase [Serpentinicella sp. ANB-PHB4]MDR5659669.1 N-acetylmuramoyl-L-alanine amidase [Serpentinicella sp. ANB-PHB4]